MLPNANASSPSLDRKAGLLTYSRGLTEKSQKPVNSASARQLLRRNGPASVVFGLGHRGALDLRNEGRYSRSMFDFAALYDAFRCRDPAWDGMVFVGVKTTGIYCLPVCPARTPLAR